MEQETAAQQCEQPSASQQQSLLFRIRIEQWLEKQFQMIGKYVWINADLQASLFKVVQEIVKDNGGLLQEQIDKDTNYFITSNKYFQSTVDPAIAFTDKDYSEQFRHYQYDNCKILNLDSCLDQSTPPHDTSTKTPPTDQCCMPSTACFPKDLCAESAERGNLAVESETPLPSSNDPRIRAEQRISAEQRIRVEQRISAEQQLGGQQLDEAEQQEGAQQEGAQQQPGSKERAECGAKLLCVSDQQVQSYMAGLAEVIA